MSSATVAVFVTGVRLQRRAMLVWTLALVATIGMTMAFWPFLRDSPELMHVNGMPPELMKQLGIEGGVFFSPLGYLQGSLFSQTLPLALTAAGAVAAIGLTVWDEEHGRMETLLALPIRRRSALLARFAVAAVLVVGLGALSWVLLAGLDLVLGFGSPVGALTAGVVMATLLGLVHTAFGFALGAGGAGRGGTLIATFGVVFVGMVVSGLAPLLAPLHWLSRISPWSWALDGQPLLNGIDVRAALALIVVAVLLVVLGAALLDRRDLRTP